MLQTKFEWKQDSGLRGYVVWKCEQKPAGQMGDGKRTERDHKSSSWADAQVNLKKLPTTPNQECYPKQNIFLFFYT